MGLTIHYGFHLKGRKPGPAHQAVEQLHAHAKSLPFRSVEDIIELTGEACDWSGYSPDHPHRWLLIQASQCLNKGNGIIDVPPSHVIAFINHPGDGCPNRHGVGIMSKRDTFEANIKTLSRLGCEASYAITTISRHFG
ncbi:MAG: hypothetical protein GC159_02060 [Phycisphaera sp.]|nr:hypothetical protein [Phycisphaera sp.]